MKNPMRPYKALGQHFLKDQKILQRILSAIRTENPRSVLEIGPGLGALTKHLTRNYPTTVVELDWRFIETLQKLPHHFPYSVIQGDILDISFKKLPGYPFDLILGNLPYNIATQILQKLPDKADSYRRAIFLVQEEVAQRLVATSGKAYGFLSIRAYLSYHIQFLGPAIPPGAFRPSPKVSSRLLSLSPAHTELEAKDKKETETLASIAFRHRRKTLYNNLKKYSKRAKPILFKAGLLQKRPEEISPNAYVKLAQKFLKEDAKEV